MGRLLSQVDTEASVSPMMNILTEKKKKKKRKSKEHVEEFDVQEVAAMEAVGLSPKKKKKKHKKEDVESKCEISEGEIEKPKKDKKKKKKKKLDDNQNETSVHSSNSGTVDGDDLSTSADASSPSKSSKSPKMAIASSNMKQILENSIHSSTKKRKFQKSIEESQSKRKSISKEVSGDKLGHLPWSVEEEEMLLEMMKKQLPVKDTKSFRITLKTLKWDEVAFENRTAEECQTQFMALISKLNTLKSLTTMVEEAKKCTGDYATRKKRVLKPLHRFMKDNVDSKEMQSAKESGENYLQAVHTAWRNLPEEKKKKYEREYDEEMERIGVSLKCIKVTHKTKKSKLRKGVELPRTPFEVWCLEKQNKLKDNPFLVNKDARVVYAGLENHEKLKYITSSLREIYDFEKKSEELKANDPDIEIPKIRGPTKDDIKLYLKDKGYPEEQYTRPFTVYYRDLMEAGELDNIQGQNKLITVMEKFKDLPEKRKTHYQDLSIKNMTDYKLKYDAWEKNQDELTLYAKQLVKTTKAPRVVAKRPVGAKEKQMATIFHNVVHFDSTCPTFHDEPTKPPTTAFKLYSMKYEHEVKQKFDSLAQKRTVLKETWENMKIEHKHMYTKRCNVLKKTYEERLIKYVKNMDKKLRKIYLGFRRKSLYSFFKSDIFQNIYPNEKYPVYELTPKKKQQPVASESEDDFVAESVLATNKLTKKGKSKKNTVVEEKSESFKKSENIKSKTKKDAKRRLLKSGVSVLDGDNSEHGRKMQATPSKSAQVGKDARPDSPTDESSEEVMEHYMASRRVLSKRTKPTIKTNKLESKQKRCETPEEDSVSDDSGCEEELVKSKSNNLSYKGSPSKTGKSVFTPMKLESDDSTDEESESEEGLENISNKLSSKKTPSIQEKSVLTPMKLESDDSSDESEEEYETTKPNKLSSKVSRSQKEKPVQRPNKSQSDESSDDSESEEESEITIPNKLSSKRSPSTKEKSVLTPMKLKSDDSSDELSDTEVGPAWKSSTSITNHQSSSSSDSN